LCWGKEKSAPRRTSANAPIYAEGRVAGDWERNQDRKKESLLGQGRGGDPGRDEGRLAPGRGTMLSRYKQETRFGKGIEGREMPFNHAQAEGLPQGGLGWKKFGSDSGDD